jgi:hypothetical protein
MDAADAVAAAEWLGRLYMSAETGQTRRKSRAERDATTLGDRRSRYVLVPSIVQIHSSGLGSVLGAARSADLTWRRLLAIASKYGAMSPLGALPQHGDPVAAELLQRGLAPGHG